MKTYIAPHTVADKIINLEKVTFIKKGWSWIDFHFDGNAVTTLTFGDIDPETDELTADPEMTTAEYNKILKIMAE
jgi:hypothetical protein